MESIGLIGRGFVGQAVFDTFKRYVKTESYDLDKAKCTVPSIKELMEKCSVVFVAVPTPIKEDGSCYLNNIHSVYSKLNKYGTNHTIILKSSVPPGTSKILNAEYKNVKTVFNPEFLREKTALYDYINQDRIILGGEDENALSKAEEAYRLAFPKPALGRFVPVYKTDCTTAEMVKFMTNIYLATKISLSNEFYCISEKLGINYEIARKLTVLDSRIGSSHTIVPGEGTVVNSGGFGFSGSCFPLNAEIIINTAEKLGVEPVIMKAVKDRNERIDRPEKDWLIEGKTIIKNKDSND